MLIFAAAILHNIRIDGAIPDINDPWPNPGAVAVNMRTGEDVRDDIVAQNFA